MRAIFAPHNSQRQLAVFMYIIALGWLFFTAMLALGKDTVVTSLLSFLLWGVAPVVLLTWTFGMRASLRRRLREEDGAKGATSDEAPEKPSGDSEN